MCMECTTSMENGFDFNGNGFDFDGVGLDFDGVGFDFDGEWVRLRWSWVRHRWRMGTTSTDGLTSDLTVVTVARRLSSLNTGIISLTDASCFLGMNHPATTTADVRVRNTILLTFN